MIKTLSPYYIDVPFLSPSGFIAGAVDVDLFIWNGLITAFPFTQTYTFVKDNPTLTNSTTKVNISRFINDFIDFNPSVSTTTSNVKGSNQVWAAYRLVWREGGLESSQLFYFLCVKGYGYGLDGQNPGLPTNNILIPINDYKVYNKFIVPILISELNPSIVTVISYPNNTLNQTFNIPATTNSDELIQNVIINVNEATGEEYIEVTYNTQVITLLITEECRYTPIDILFQNKEGAAQIITMFKKMTESMNVTSEMFESDNGQPIDGHHQYTKYNVQAKSKFTVSSGFVGEEMNESFKQLLLCERCWMYKGDNLIPLNIASKNIEYKTRANDRLINYVLEFEYAFNEVNNI